MKSASATLAAPDTVEAPSSVAKACRIPRVLAAGPALREAALCQDLLDTSA